MRAFITGMGDMPQPEGECTSPALAQPHGQQGLTGSMACGFLRTLLKVAPEGACMAFSLTTIPNRIHKTFANLRTGIVLLILVVIASALGTVILQRPATDPDKLSQAYSPAMLRFLDPVML